MAISTRTEGTWEVAGANATSYQFTIPTHQTGDMLLLRFWLKPSTATDPSTFSPSIDQSWTLAGNGYTYTNVSGNGSGSLYAGIAYKVAGSSSETNPTLTYGTSSSVSGGVIDVWQISTGSWVTPASIYLGFTATSSLNLTMGSNPGVTAGDVCVVGVYQTDNNTVTVPTFTQSGITWDTVTIWPSTAFSTATGNDADGSGAYRTASSGTASAAPVVTATFSASDEGIVTFTRLRNQAATNYPVTVADSVSTLSETNSKTLILNRAVPDSLSSVTEAAVRAATAVTRATSAVVGTLTELAGRIGTYIRREHRPSDG